MNQHKIIFSIMLITFIFIFPIQSSFGHAVVSSEECKNLGLVLQNNVCVSDLNIICITELHADLIGGGFRNTGTDQFGNSCTELHPSTGDSFFPRSPATSFLEELLPFIIIGLLIIAGIVIGIIFVIRRLRK